MEILLNYRSKIPIYEQIIFQIKQLILTGQLTTGTSLPAMRSLAKSLRVSVITVQKAYEELQRDGFIDSVVGKGTFVSTPDIDKIQKEYLSEIEKHLDEVINLMKNSGLSTKEMVAMFENKIKDGDF